jgi:hypothetical protein
MPLHLLEAVLISVINFLLLSLTEFAVPSCIQNAPENLTVFEI